MRTKELFNILSDTEWKYSPLPLGAIESDVIFFELWRRKVITLDELANFLKRLERSPEEAKK